MAFSIWTDTSRSNVGTWLYELMRAARERYNACGLSLPLFFKTDGSTTNNIALSDINGMRPEWLYLNLSTIIECVNTLSSGFPNGRFVQVSGSDTLVTRSWLLDQAGYGTDWLSINDAWHNTGLWEQLRVSFQHLIYQRWTPAYISGGGAARIATGSDERNAWALLAGETPQGSAYQPTILCVATFFGGSARFCASENYTVDTTLVPSNVTHAKVSGRLRVYGEYGLTSDTLNENVTYRMVGQTVATLTAGTTYSLPTTIGDYSATNTSWVRPGLNSTVSRSIEKTNGFTTYPFTANLVSPQSVTLIAEGTGIYVWATPDFEYT